MPSLLDSVRKLISDAIWDEVDVSEEIKMRVSNCIETECTSLEKARVFITKRRLVVVLPEDLANANQAEENSCVGDPRAGLALEADPTDNTAFPRELADVNEAKAKQREYPGQSFLPNRRTTDIPSSQSTHWVAILPRRQLEITQRIASNWAMT